MSINITTSDYTQLREAVIDGIEFKVRPMNSSESIALTTIGTEIQEAGKDTEKIAKLIRKIEDIFFSLFDKEKEARKVLQNIPTESLWKIYDKIIKGEDENV